MALRRHFVVEMGLLSALAYVAVSSAPQRSSLADVPIVLSTNKPYVRVRVNGSEPLWFLLDTGSVSNAVDVEQAKALGIASKGGQQVSGAGEGTATSSTASDVSLRVGGLELPKDDVDILPLRLLLSSSAGLAVDGLLGYPFFRRFAVEIDYAGGVVRVHDSRTYRSSSKGQAIPLELVRGNVVTSATLVLDGGRKISGQFLVDTGWRSALSLTAPLVAQRKLLAGVHTIEATTGMGIGGPTVDAVGRIEGLRLGKFTILRPVVNFSRARHGILSQSDLAGIIGGDILKRFKVVFDYHGKRMVLEPGPAFDEPYEFDMSGIFLVTDGQNDGTFRIAQLVSGSPAFEFGLRADDVIEKVQGRPASQFSLEQLRQLLSDGPGKEVTLTTRRDGRQIETTIRLRRLI